MCVAQFLEHIVQWTNSKLSVVKFLVVNAQPMTGSHQSSGYLTPRITEIAFLLEKLKNIASTKYKIGFTIVVQLKHRRDLLSERSENK